MDRTVAVKLIFLYLTIIHIGNSNSNKLTRLQQGVATRMQERSALDHYGRSFLPSLLGKLFKKENVDGPTLSEKSGVLHRKYLPPPTITKRAPGGRERWNPSLQEEACQDGGRVITCTKGTVTSLGYPDVLPGNLTCAWRILAQSNEVVEVNFIDISLETQECLSISYRGAAYQSLYDNVETICGKSPPRKFTSVGNELDISLTTGGVKHGRGLLFDFRSRVAVECEDLVELIGAEGSLASAGYPEPYNPEARCAWRIVGETGKTLTVHIISLAVEYSRSCEYDSLQVFDGPSTDSRVLGVFCGHVTPQEVVTSSNIAFVVLTSDGSGEDRGFNLTWTSN